MWKDRLQFLCVATWTVYQLPPLFCFYYCLSSSNCLANDSTNHGFARNEGSKVSFALPEKRLCSSILGGKCELNWSAPRHDKSDCCRVLFMVEGRGISSSKRIPISEDSLPTALLLEYSLSSTLDH